MERVINPKTKKYINVDGPTYNKLVEEGYAKSYLNSLKTVEDLQLNLKTDEQVQYTDDVILTLIKYLPLQELFAFYHTNKQFHKLMNSKIFIDYINKTYDINVHNFMDFINIMIYNKYKVNMNDLYKDDNKSYRYVFDDIWGYNVIYKEYKKGNLISVCNTTKRTTRSKGINVKLCESKQTMRKEYAKEIDNLYGSKNNKEYEKNLNQLEYAIYYKLLQKV